MRSLMSPLPHHELEGLELVVLGWPIFEGVLVDKHALVGLKLGDGLIAWLTYFK